MASWARWALRPSHCAECRMSLTRCVCLGGVGVRGGTREAVWRGAEGSQSARLGETSSRWGATLLGRDRWRSIRGLRGGCPRVSGCSGGGGCRQDWGLWEVELRRKLRGLGWGILWGPVGSRAV